MTCQEFDRITNTQDVAESTRALLSAVIAHFEECQDCNAKILAHRAKTCRENPARALAATIQGLALRLQFEAGRMDDPEA